MLQMHKMGMAISMAMVTLDMYRFTVTDMYMVMLAMGAMDLVTVVVYLGAAVVITTSSTDGMSNPAPVRSTDAVALTSVVVAYKSCNLYIIGH